MKVAYLETIGWRVTDEYGCPVRTVLSMGDRMCVVDPFGHVDEIRKFEITVTDRGRDES